MVISLGWLSPATSCGLPAARTARDRASLLIWPCSDWGLPCHDRCRPRGGLLPHLFTLTPWIGGGLFSVALSVASRRPGVTWQSALWSSDFPRSRPTLQRPATIPPHQYPSIKKLSVLRLPRQGGSSQLLISRGLSDARGATCCPARRRRPTAGRRAKTRCSPGRRGGARLPSRTDRHRGARARRH